MNPVVKIEVENILGIEKLTVEPKDLTVVSGENGAGKTSFLEAVRSVMTEGHDPSLLRIGSQSGLVRLTLADGSTMVKTITAKSSSFTGTHPRLGKISRARAWVDSVVDELGRDPLSLIYCPSAKRAALLADLLVVNVSKSDLDAAAPGFPGPPKLEGLDRIEAIKKAVYDERTAVNRTAKDKRTTAEQLKGTLPPTNGTPVDVTALRVRKTAVEGEEREKERAAAAVRESAQKGIRQNTQSELDLIREATAAQIKKIEAERDAAIERIKERGLQRLQERDDAFDVTVRELHAASAPVLESLAAEIATAEAAEREHQRAEKTREIIATASEEATKAETRALALSESIARLDALRTKLLASLPVVGLEIREGMVYLDGLPFDRVNTARQIEISLQVAALRAKEVPLLVSDHGEALDESSWDALRESATQLGMSVIIARRTEGPLAVETIQKEESW